MKSIMIARGNQRREGNDCLCLNMTNTTKNHFILFARPLDFNLLTTSRSSLWQCHWPFVYGARVSKGGPKGRPAVWSRRQAAEVLEVFNGFLLPFGG